MSTPPKVPAYKLHKGSGQAFVRLGKRFVYLGAHGSPESHEAYARVVADILVGRPPTAAPKSAPASSRPRLTVREIVDRYIDFAGRSYVKNGAPTSEAGVIASACGAVADSFGSLPADEFGPLCLEAIREKFIADGRTRSGVNGAVSRVVRMFRWAGSHSNHMGSRPAALSGDCSGSRKARPSSWSSSIPCEGSVVGVRAVYHKGVNYYATVLKQPATSDSCKVADETRLAVWLATLQLRAITARAVLTC